LENDLLFEVEKWIRVSTCWHIEEIDMKTDKCPECGEKMESGFINTQNADILWLKKGEDKVALHLQLQSRETPE
jgi:uncharacterized protein (UPF0212 family)